MEFNPINGFGALIVVLMLLPNIVYAVRFPNRENLCKNRMANLLEQLGRYSTMILMVLPLGVWEFSFPSVGNFLIYLLGNGGLLLIYWGCWGIYFRRPGKKCAALLAVVPACIFLLSGMMLGHWLLVIAAVIFGGAHLYVSMVNEKKRLESF